MILLVCFIPMAAIFLAACVSDPETSAPPDSDTPDLTAPRMRWEENEPAAYAYTVSRHCFCAGGPVHVVADRDSVVSAVAEPGRGLPEILPDIQIYSMDSLFAEVQSASARDAHSRRLSFDATYGFPDSVAIDFSAQMADEEYSLVITDFRILP